MSKKSAFRHYPLNQAKKYQVHTDNFLGVDYTTQKFLVGNGRAIDLKNYIFNGQYVQKRHGYEQLLLVDDFEYVPEDFENPGNPLSLEVRSNDKNINSVWTFEAEDGNVHTIAHIGKLLYEIKNIDSNKITAVPLTHLDGNGDPVYVNGLPYYLAYEFENYKSYAFVGGKKLWFLGGNKYMCLRFYKSGNEADSVITSLFAVEDNSFTPIPVTTISISYEGSVVSQRMGLDKVNLMNKWRINKLISGTSKTEENTTQFYEYVLDAPLITKNPKDMCDVSITINERGKFE